MPVRTKARASVAKARGEEEAKAMDDDFEFALESARAAGWIGPVQGEPRLFSLPTRDELRHGYVWTRPADHGDEGGQTVIAAPIDWPRLGEPDAQVD